jgi:hypothetical protein
MIRGARSIGSLTRKGFFSGDREKEAGSKGMGGSDKIAEIALFG